jgi:RimJ/RimL family protein N-acetyltransferase
MNGRDAVLEGFRPKEMERQAGVYIAGADEADRWLQDRASGREQGTEYAWAVVEGDGGTGRRVLGNVMLSAIDRRHDTAWISYWTVEAARGRGVASEALRMMSSWAIDDLGLFRLELGHRTNNVASCRVATAAGYPVEGLERGKLLYDGERFDVETHARLATDPDSGSAN